MAASSDDGEEAAGGAVDLASSDLELVRESSTQTVALRFRGVAIPPGATILAAHVQFQVDETGSAATTLTIAGQASDDAAPFARTTRNLSTRARTAAAVGWTPPAWPAAGAAGAAQRTPDLAPIVQEIVDRPGWSSGNALALLVTGTGKRVAESFDGVPGGAPLLHLEYRLGP